MTAAETPPLFPKRRGEGVALMARRRTKALAKGCRKVFCDDYFRPTDYREAARRRLPPFLFHYIDGGANAEHTLRCNVDDLAGIALRQRVLRNVADLSLETELFGTPLAMPVVLAPG